MTYRGGHDPSSLGSIRSPIWSNGELGRSSAARLSIDFCRKATFRAFTLRNLVRFDPFFKFKVYLSFDQMFCKYCQSLLVWFVVVCAFEDCWKWSIGTFIMISRLGTLNAISFESIFENSSLYSVNWAEKDDFLGWETLKWPNTPMVRYLYGE